MGYAKCRKTSKSKSAVPNQPKKNRAVKIAIAVVLGLLIIGGHYYLTALDDEKRRKSDAAFHAFSIDTERIQIDGALRSFLISLQTYYKYWEIDPELEFNAMFGKLKIELQKNGHVNDAIDGLVKDVIEDLEHDKFDIIKSRREANERFRKDGRDGELVAISREYMMKRFYLYVQHLNVMYFRCFSETMDTDFLKCDE